MLFGLTYEEIVEKIKEKGLSDEEIQKKIKEKLKQLSGLISKEGAAQIVATELGVKTFREVGKVKINEIRAGMRDIEVDGKVVSVFGVRGFKTEKREGKVGSLLLGDESGQMRIVFWDENHIKRIEDKEITEGSILKIKNTYCKDNNGFKELHTNARCEVILNPNGVSINNVSVNKPAFEISHKKIKELGENDRNVILRGTVVQLFEPRFYEVCEICGKRAMMENGSFKCGDHGNVNVKYAAVLNMYFDDGTEAIRVACFRESAANVLGINEDELSKVKDNPLDFEKLKSTALGRQLEVSGRASKNEMFNRMEFVANFVQELKPENLLKDVV